MFKHMFNRIKWQVYVLGFIVFIFLLLVLLYVITNSVKIHYALNSSDTFAFAQLVLSIILLPTVLFGFFITIQAFRESQDIPELDLFLETEPGVHEKSLKFNSSDILIRRKSATQSIYQSDKPIALVVKNTGNAIALWYAVDINIQFDAPPQGSYLDWAQFYKTDGDHWQQNLAELQRSRKLEAMFLSNGKLAAYPKMPLKICEMNTGWFLHENSPTKDYQISYTIVTDRGHKKQGFLNLSFQARLYTSLCK